MSFEKDATVVLTHEVRVHEGPRAGYSYSLNPGTRGTVQRIVEEFSLCSVLFEGQEHPHTVALSTLERA